MAASRKSQLWPRITRARVPSLAHAEVPATPQSANAAGQRPPKKACGPRALPRPPQGLPRHARRAATLRGQVGATLTSRGWAMPGQWESATASAFDEGDDVHTTARTKRIIADSNCG